jgi:hypothetical protein
MLGLLATHMLGQEFSRTVCVHPVYESFYTAFAPTSMSCAKLFQCEHPTFHGDKIRLLNFRKETDECILKERLNSSERLVWIEANTYPRWTEIPESLWFTDHYRPQPALLGMLPWKNPPPQQVVHLRAPDNVNDVRKGLDNSTLVALGSSLPSTTFLVTNKVQWYSWFAEHYGWSHPPWSSVTHSALALSWGDRQGQPTPRVARQKDETRIRDLQMWADWYTLLQASSIIHTHSAFSSSAAYWMKIMDSHVLEGIDVSQAGVSDAGSGGIMLRLLPEELHRQKNPTVTLSQRHDDPNLPQQVRLDNCEGII